MTTLHNTLGKPHKHTEVSLFRELVLINLVFLKEDTSKFLLGAHLNVKKKECILCSFKKLKGTLSRFHVLLKYEELQCVTNIQHT